MPQNAKATLAQRTPPPTDFIPDSGGGGDFIPDAPAPQGPTQFEQQRSPGAQRGFLGTLGDRISGAVSGAAKSASDAWTNWKPVDRKPDNMADIKASTSGPGRVMSEMGRQATRPLPSDLDNPIYRAATTLSPLTPVNPERMEQQSETGDTGGVAADALLATGQAVAPSLASRIPGATGALRGRVGEFLHDARTGEAMSPYKAAVEKIAPEPTARVADRAQGQATNLNARMNLKAQADTAAEAAKADAAARQPVPISEGPTAPQHAAVRGAQADVARHNARQFVPISEGPTGGSGVGVPGSAAQEAGYQPPVLRVPIRPEPSSPLTPEQVPGPDTAGKGNLLTPAARRGDPRAAQETMRRGRRVMYVPAEEYEGTRLQGTLTERMGQPQNPTLSQRTGTPTAPPSVTPESGGAMRSSEIAPMSPVEKAEIEQMAGRKLTDAEAYAERRKQAEWTGNRALAKGTVDVDPKQSAGLRDTQAKRKR